MGGRLNLELVRAMLTFKKKYSGGAKIKIGGAMPPAGDAPEAHSSLAKSWLRT